MARPVTPDRLEAGYAAAVDTLLSERHAGGWWVGELSASALSTATAVVAITRMGDRGETGNGPRTPNQLVHGGLKWLVDHQNQDGGWGDTVRSVSNISTTMLAHAAFYAAGRQSGFATTLDRAKAWITNAGGVEAVLKRYGRDRTFSVPILTHCAIAGLVDWDRVIPLPFELSCVPARCYRMIRLPVVSYALPALIAIGLARFHARPPRNPALRVVRQAARRPSLKLLDRIQPPNGGFLEAPPLTSFVTMSLASAGLADHPVARHGLQFIVRSVRPDGSWPIDTNLATWTTTLAVNALGPDLLPQARPAVIDWLVGQQFRELHPCTNAAPGGWAWTDLPGGVPDADDTAGAILALLNLVSGGPLPDRINDAVANGVSWLLDLQNGDGGWPTFCRGWGTMPFDRSAPDISAHVLRSMHHWSNCTGSGQIDQRTARRIPRATQRGFDWLQRCQRADGSWLPLWFGNQHNVHAEENPVYGTSRVLAALIDTGRGDSPPTLKAIRWLAAQQNEDGGWGGVRGTPSSVEETSVAVQQLVRARPESESVVRGLDWLLSRVEAGTFGETAPIGFYFAKLWYFERLYPLAAAVAALHSAVDTFARGKPVHTVLDRED